MRPALAILCALFVAPSTPVHGQVHVPDPDSIAIAEHARGITTSATTDSARAAAIYEWIAGNVRYDVDGYLVGDLAAAVMTPEHVWRKRLALCDGYSNLFVRMAREVGVEAEQVRGYAKGFDHRPGRKYKRMNHAWVAIRLDGEWRLADPTWGSGFVQRNAFIPTFTWFYFLIDPDALILTHLPDERGWQLVEDRLSKQEWERMTAVSRTLLELGFRPEALRIASGRKSSIPEAYESNVDVTVYAAPYSGTIAAGQPVSFDLLAPGAQAMAVYEGDSWTHLDGNHDARFMGVVTPAAGPVTLFVKPAGQDQAFQAVLTYQAR
jgi:hypothetical protein